MKNFNLLSLVAFSLFFVGTSATSATLAPKNAKAYIVSPLDGAKVKSPVKVVFGLEGMGVAPAGVKSPKTGHHHLLVDVKKLPNTKLPLPADKNHIHFGGGQTETTVDLEPGEHTLQLIMGDHTHIPHNPPILSEKITITVVK
ncbi:DUF4399 domain-containing protein [bacterium]|nr:DUF4399 domain-containing protein [bacterium]